jgi:hypothetical protein
MSTLTKGLIAAAVVTGVVIVICVTVPLGVLLSVTTTSKFEKSLYINKMITN